MPLLLLLLCYALINVTTGHRGDWTNLGANGPCIAGTKYIIKSTIIMCMSPPTDRGSPPIYVGFDYHHFGRVYVNNNRTLCLL